MERSLGTDLCLPQPVWGRSLAAARLVAQSLPPRLVGWLASVVVRLLPLPKRGLAALALEVRRTRSAEQVPHFQSKGE
jgi:hypothetical protein